MNNTNLTFKISKVLRLVLVFLLLINNIFITHNVYSAWSISVISFNLKWSVSWPYYLNPWDTFAVEFMWKNDVWEALNNVKINLSFSDNSAFWFDWTNHKSRINWTETFNPIPSTSYDSTNWFVHEVTNWSNPSVWAWYYPNMVKNSTSQSWFYVEESASIYEVDLNAFFSWKKSSDWTDVVWDSKLSTIYLNVKPHVKDYYFEKSWVTTTSIKNNWSDSVDLVVEVKDYNWCSNIDSANVTANLSNLWLWSSETLTYSSCDTWTKIAKYKKNWITTLSPVWSVTFSPSDFSVTDEDSNVSDYTDANFNSDDRQTELSFSIESAGAPSVSITSIDDDYIWWNWQTSTTLYFSSAQFWSWKVVLNWNNTCSAWSVIKDWYDFPWWNDSVNISSATLSEWLNTVYVCVRNNNSEIGSANDSITKDTTFPVTSFVWMSPANVTTWNPSTNFSCSENWYYKVCINSWDTCSTLVQDWTSTTAGATNSVQINNALLSIWSNTIWWFCKDEAWNEDVWTWTVTKQQPTPSMNWDVTWFSDNDTDYNGLDWRDITITWDNSDWLAFSWFDSWRIYVLPYWTTLSTSTHTRIALIPDASVSERTWLELNLVDSAWNSFVDWWSYVAYVLIMWNSWELWEAWSSSQATLNSDTVQNAAVLSAKFTSDTILELTTDANMDTDLNSHSWSLISYEVNSTVYTWVWISSVNWTKINVTIPSLWDSSATWTNLTMLTWALHSDWWWYNNYYFSWGIIIEDWQNPTISSFQKNTAWIYWNYYNWIINFTWNFNEEMKSWDTKFQIIRVSWNSDPLTHNLWIVTSSKLQAWNQSYDVDSDKQSLVCWTNYRIRMIWQDIAWNSTSTSYVENIIYDKCWPTKPVLNQNTTIWTWTFDLTWLASTDDSWRGSWIASYSLKLYNWTWCNSLNNTYDWITSLSKNLTLASNTYSWKVNAVDNVGNVWSWSNCDDFVVDTDVPVVSNFVITDTDLGSTDYTTDWNNIQITADVSNSDSDHIRFNLTTLAWSSTYNNVLCSSTWTPSITCNYDWNSVILEFENWFAWATSDWVKQVAITVQNTNWLNEQTSYEWITNDISIPTVSPSAITSPNWWETIWWTYEITWNSSLITDSVWLDYIKLEYATWAWVWNFIMSWANSGSYEWDAWSLASSAWYNLRITAYDLVWNSASDTTDSSFTIDWVPPTVSPSTITFPNWWEMLKWWTSYNITWNAWWFTDDIGMATNPIDLYYSLDNWSNYTSISTSESNDWTYSWTVPSIDSTQWLIKIVWWDVAWNNWLDVSDSVFFIDSVLPVVDVNYTTETWNSPVNSSYINSWGFDVSLWVTDTYLNKVYYRLYNNSDLDYWDDTNSIWTWAIWNEICSDWTVWWTDGSCNNVLENIKANIEDWDEYKLVFKWDDEAWNEKLSEEIVYNWDDTPPQVWVWLVEWAYYSWSVTISWTWSDVWWWVSSVVLQIKKWSNYWDGDSFESWEYSLSTTTSDQYVNWSYVFDIPWADSEWTEYDITAIVTDKSYTVWLTWTDQKTIKKDSEWPTIVESWFFINPSWWEVFSGWENVQIEWNSWAISDWLVWVDENSVSLYYSSDWWSNWTWIVTSENNDWVYSWTLPSVDWSTYKIKLWIKDNIWNYSEVISDFTFWIDSVWPNITVTYAGSWWNTPTDSSYINSSWFDVSVWATDSYMDKLYYRFYNSTDWDYWNPTGWTWQGSEIWNEICVDWTNWWTDWTCNNVLDSIQASIEDWDTYKLSFKWNDEAWNETISSEITYNWDESDPVVWISLTNWDYFSGWINISWTWYDSWAWVSDVVLQISRAWQFWDGDSFEPWEYSLATNSSDWYANWTYNFTVPIGDAELTEYQIKAIITDNSYTQWNTWTDIKTIKKDREWPTIVESWFFISPVWWESLWWGDNLTLQWNSWAITDSASGLSWTPISLYYFDWSSWHLISEWEVNDWNYDWTIPTIDTANWKVKIEAYDNLWNMSDVVSNAFKIDTNPPSISTVTTLDQDADWSIDWLYVEFNEDVDDSTILTWDFSISNWIQITSFNTALTPHDTDIILNFNNTWNSSMTPNLSYTQWSLEDIAWNKMLTVSNISSNDGAVPRLISAEIYDTNSNWKLDQIKAYFSENMATTTDLSTWTLENPLDWVTLDSVSVLNEVATIDLSEWTNINTSTWWMQISFSSNGNWQDISNNQAGSKTNLNITDKAPPVFYEDIYTDTNANSKTDQIVLTASENLSWLNMGDFTLNWLWTWSTVATWYIDNKTVKFDLNETSSNYETVLNLSYDYTQWTLSDVDWNLVENISWEYVTDWISPKLLYKVTFDADWNWFMDWIWLTYSEELNNNTWSLVINVDWYSVNNYVSASNYVNLILQEKATYDWDITPNFDISTNNSLWDITWNLAKTQNWLSTTDWVWPIIIWARYDTVWAWVEDDVLYLTFSEAISWATVWSALNDFVLANWWSFSVNSAFSLDSSTTASITMWTWSTELQPWTTTIWIKTWEIEDIYWVVSPTQWTQNQALVTHSIVINEVMYATTQANQYIELRNLWNSSLSLSGWVIQNAWWTWVDLTIPSWETIWGNWYYLISHSSESSNILSVTPNLVDGTLNLLTPSNANLVLTDWVVSYDSVIASPWPYWDASTPKSMERKEVPWDWLTEENWYTAESSDWFDDTTSKWTPWSENVFDSISPTVSDFSPINNSLLPSAPTKITISYSDNLWWVWVDTTTDTISLSKWNWTSWQNESTKILLWQKQVYTTNALYPLDSLGYWKYKIDYSIDDNAWNTVNETVIFYVDKFSLTIDENDFELWPVFGWNQYIRWESTVTVSTVWAWFQIDLSKDSFSNWNNDLEDYSWDYWFWYDLYKNENWSIVDYDWIYQSIDWSTIIDVWTWSLDTNWNLKVYTYKIKYYIKVSALERAWVYSTNLINDVEIIY